MNSFRILEGDKNTLNIDIPIDGLQIQRACSTIKMHGITKLWISNECLSVVESLNFLTNFLGVTPEILEVSLLGRFCDLNNLYVFNNLEYLSCDVINEEKVDLSRFPKLKKLSTSRLESFINLSASHLQALHFYGYFEPYPRPKLNPELLSQLKHLRSLNLSHHVIDFTFEDVTELDNLERVIIVQCNIKNFNGIEKFPSLKSVVANYCSSLNDISAIKKLPNLLNLDLGPCPRLKDLNVLASNDNLRALCLNSYKNVDIEIIKTLKELRFLYLYHCNPIPSIKFIDDLKKMVGLTLLSTKIIDGDLTPAMRLKDTDIMVMRHYNIDEDKLPSDMKYSYPYSIDLLLNS